MSLRCHFSGCRITYNVTLFRKKVLFSFIGQTQCFVSERSSNHLMWPGTAGAVKLSLNDWFIIAMVCVIGLVLTCLAL